MNYTPGYLQQFQHPYIYAHTEYTPLHPEYIPVHPEYIPVHPVHTEYIPVQVAYHTSVHSEYIPVQLPYHTPQVYHPVRMSNNTFHIGNNSHDYENSSFLEFEGGVDNNVKEDRKQIEINPYRIMICGSDRFDPTFIKRFIKQIKNYTIVVGSSTKLDEVVAREANLSGLEVRISTDYNNIKDKSSRLYAIYTKDHPFKIYILDNDYEENKKDYVFTKYIPNTVDIVVVKSNYYG